MAVDGVFVGPLIAAGATGLVNLVFFAYGYGRLSAKVEALGQRLGIMEQHVIEAPKRLERIARLEQWKEGQERGGRP